MPLLALPAFTKTHARPYILFADLAPPIRRETCYALLASLADRMNLRGDYALAPQDACIRVMIELEADARVFAAAVQVRKTAREGGWAGQWWFSLDAKTDAAIKAVLPPPVPKRRKRPPA